MWTTIRHITALDLEISGRPPAGEPQTCCIKFSSKVGPWDCPVKRCKGMTYIMTGLYVQLLHSHVQGTMINLGEGNLTHPRCNCCDMIVPWAALNGLHPNIPQCKKEAERNRHSMVVGGIWDSTKKNLWMYGRPITLVTYFKYLGSILTASDNDWPRVTINLQKVRKKWAQMMSILVQ